MAYLMVGLFGFSFPFLSTASSKTLTEAKVVDQKTDQCYDKQNGKHD